MTMLCVEGAGVEAGGRLLLAGFDLAVSAGEAVGIVGPSGCGKTSLLRGLALLHPDFRGSVRLEGSTPAELGVPVYRRRVVYTAQAPAFHDEPLGDALRRVFGYGTRSGSFPREDAAGLLSALGIHPKRLRQNVTTLSLGQQQRAAIVRSLIVGPRVLLLDEPTSALDARSARRLEEVLLEESRRRGMALVIVSHDQGRLGRLCRRWIDLRQWLRTEARK